MHAIARESSIGSANAFASTGPTKQRIQRKASVSESCARRDWAARMRIAIAGNETVYNRLLEDIAIYVRAVAYKTLCGAQMSDTHVEDIVQETLIAIHLSRHRWDPNRKLEPWVAAVAYHKCIDLIRRSTHKKTITINRLEDELTAPELDPNVSGDLRRLMRDLKPRQRDIVMSVSIEGHSVSDTAARLSMSVVAVRVALHRALKAMATRLHSSAVMD